MTRVLRRIKKVVESNDFSELTPVEQNDILVAISSLNNTRRMLNTLREGRAKALVYTALDDLELRIAEAIEEKMYE